MAEGGGRKSASGSGEKTTPDLIGHEVGGSGGMGGLTAYLLCMREGDGLQGRGEDPIAVVETCVSG